MLRLSRKLGPQMEDDDCIAKIERLENGYEVTVCDPSITASNKNPKKPYQDPWKSYAFTTDTEVLDFLKKSLPTLQPEDDDMETNFSRAVSEGDK